MIRIKFFCEQKNFPHLCTASGAGAEAANLGRARLDDGGQLSPAVTQSLEDKTTNLLLESRLFRG